MQGLRIMYGGPGIGTDIKEALHAAVNDVSRKPDFALANAIDCGKVRAMAAVGDYEGIGKYVSGIIDAQNIMMDSHEADD